jgi:hypothetical protein
MKKDNLIILETDIITNDTLDECFNNYINTNYIGVLLHIIFSPFSYDNMYPQPTMYKKLKKLNNKQKKYMLYKLDELSPEKKFVLVDIYYTRNVLYSLKYIINNSITSTMLKSDIINKTLEKLPVSLLIDIANVHINKYYDTHLIEHEFYSHRNCSIMLLEHFYFPEHYLTNELYMYILLTNPYLLYSDESYYFKIPNQILDTILTENLCYILLTKSYDVVKTFKKIPDKFKTEKLCKLYITKVGKQGLNDIPEDLINNILMDDMCSYAIRCLE